MAFWHLRSNKTKTGKKLNKFRKKRRLDKGSKFLDTRIEKRKVKIKRARGGNKKIKLLSAEFINVADKGKVKKTKILSVIENKANPHYVRRNILTKGGIVKTDLGLVKITSRPGQDGIINGVLIKK